MPIPTINLIPAAYYLRKKAKVAWALAVVVLLLEGAALVATALHQNSVRAELAARQTAAQTTVDRIAGINTQVQSEKDAVKDLTDKTTFIDTAINPQTGKNVGWAKLFKTLARYTYPGAVVTSITPTANDKRVMMHLRYPAKDTLHQVTLVALMWRNLRRCPIIDKVVPTYSGSATDATGGSSSIGGAPMPGMPSAGGPPMPGMPTSGRYIGSAISLAGPAVEGMSNYSQQLGGPSIGMPSVTMPTDATGGLGGAPSGPPQPPMYDMDLTIDLLNKIETASTGPAPAQTQ